MLSSIEAGIITTRTQLTTRTLSFACSTRLVRVTKSSATSASLPNPPRQAAVVFCQKQSLRFSSASWSCACAPSEQHADNMIGLEELSSPMSSKTSPFRCHSSTALVFTLLFFTGPARSCRL